MTRGDVKYLIVGYQNQIENKNKSSNKQNYIIYNMVITIGYATALFKKKNYNCNIIIVIHYISGTGGSKRGVITLSCIG